MKAELQSVVIVMNGFGSVATIRFNDYKQDRIISSTSKSVLYTLIERHVQGVLNV